MRENFIQAGAVVTNPPNPMRDENYFEDAADLVRKKKRKGKRNKKKIKKGNHICNCGAFEKYNALWSKWHDVNCLINLKGKKR